MDFDLDPDGLYYRLKLPVKIDGCDTVHGLAVKGCPQCNKRFNVEASMGFGSLICPDHGNVWHWIPGRRDRWDYTPRAWKNNFTNKCSPEWKKRFPDGR